MFRQSPDKDATYTVQSRSERALTPEAAFLARTAPEDRLRLGQVFTPPALAQAMVAWIAPLRPTSILDPAVGTGALLAAWRAWEAQRGEGASPATLTGYDVDGRALDLARGRLSGDVRLAQASALSEGLRGGLEDQDAVLANPPFVRAGWCAPETRAEMQALALRLGVPLGPRANLYLAVALAGLAALRPGGRAALLLPASALTSEAARNFREALRRGWLKGVLRLPPGARPFPGHSVGACLLQIERPPGSISGPLFASPPTSRAPGRSTRTVPAAPDGLTPLADLAVVRRGLATGANGFFHISDATVARWGLLPSACLACIGRAADAPGHDVTQDTLQGLREAGHPTWLFAPGRRAEAIDGALIDEVVELGASYAFLALV
ncbi:MAG: N-6 DNA methylase [Pseudomonadota bacterium]